MSDAITVTDYFGGCPHCGANHGFLNVRAEHWIVCDAHKVKWCVGFNLFSSCKDENESVWLANAEKLASYSKVEPLPEGKWSSDAAARERQLEAGRSMLNELLAAAAEGAAPATCSAFARDTGGEDIPF
jgi:hypothetical protein